MHDTHLQVAQQKHHTPQELTRLKYEHDQQIANTQLAQVQLQRKAEAARQLVRFLLPSVRSVQNKRQLIALPVCAKLSNAVAEYCTTTATWNARRTERSGCGSKFRTSAIDAGPATDCPFTASAARTASPGMCRHLALIRVPAILTNPRDRITRKCKRMQRWPLRMLPRAPRLKTANQPLRRPIRHPIQAPLCLMGDPRRRHQWVRARLNLDS